MPGPGPGPARDAPVRDLGFALRRLPATLLRSRCPACGVGEAARDHFRLRERCERCGARFERDPGAYLVAVALNYFLTAGLTLALGLALVLRYGFFDALVPLLIGVAVAVGLLIYRPAKALYLWLLWVFGFVYPDRAPEA